MAVGATGFNLGGSNSVINLGPLADTYLKGDARLYCFAGLNDIVINGDSAATVFGYFSTWLAARIAAGWTYSQIWFLVPLPSNAGGSGFEATRQSFISLVVADAASKGYHLVRLDQDAVIGMNGDQNNMTYYLPDGIHPTDAGDMIIATDAKNTP